MSRLFVSCFLTSIVSSFLLQIAEEEEVAGDVDNIHDDQEPPRDLQLRHEAPALELASGVHAGVVQNVGQTCLQLVFSNFDINNRKFTLSHKIGTLLYKFC